MTSLADKFPDFLNEILNEFTCYFAGSSLIHDVYFPEEDWGERDYDVWCSKINFDKINLKLCKEGNVPIRMEYFKKAEKYQKTIAISEYKIQNKKLQLINIGNNVFNFTEFDFSFLQCYYDGKKIHTHNQYEPHLKIGTISRTDKNTQERIIKYQKRGFHFLNLCFGCFKNMTQQNFTEEVNYFLCHYCCQNTFVNLPEVNYQKIISI